MNASPRPCIHLRSAADGQRRYLGGHLVGRKPGQGWKAGRRAGLDDLGARWKVHPGWWLIAFTPLVLYLVVAVALWLTQGIPMGMINTGRFLYYVSLMGNVGFLGALGMAALPVWILTFGIGEETGWRKGALLCLLQLSFGYFGRSGICLCFSISTMFLFCQVFYLDCWQVQSHSPGCTTAPREVFLWWRYGMGLLTSPLRVWTVKRHSQRSS